MSDIMEEVRKEGLLKGKKEGLLKGKKEGLLQGKKEAIIILIKSGLLPLEKIAEIYDMPLKRVQEIAFSIQEA